MKHFPIILVLLVAVIGCKYLRPAQKIASETADAAPVETISDSSVSLNGEPSGTLVNLEPLRTKVGEIMKARESNGIFKMGSNEIENSVFVLAESAISVGRLTDLVRSINEQGGKSFIPNTEGLKDVNNRIAKEPESHAPPLRITDLNGKLLKVDIDSDPNVDLKPNPLTLVVRTGNADKVWLPFFSFTPVKAKQYAYTAAFEFTDDPLTLKVRRLQTNSIEISADDNYFINEKVNIMPDSDPDIIDVKQWAIPATDLQTELSKIVSGETKLRIITSEKASYAGLLKVFEAAEKLNVDFEVLVRKHDMKRR